MRALVVLFCLLVCSVVLASPEPRAVRLRGYVTDPTGAVIPRAEALVRWDATDLVTKTNVGIKENISSKTNDEGIFSINIPPGFYDLIVMRDGFSPEARKIRLKTPGNTLSLEITMKVDPLVATEAKPVVVEAKPR